MILTRNASKEIYEYLEDTRLVGKLVFSESDLAAYFHTINVLNSLDEETTVFNKTTIDEYEIDEVFSTMIIPGKITFSGDDDQVDLRSDKYEKYDGSKYGFEGIKVLKPSKFEAIGRAIVCSRRKTPNPKSVESLKGLVAATSYISREVSPDGLVIKQTAAYFPILFKIQIKERICFNYSANEMLKKYFRQQLNSNKQPETKA